MCLADVSASLAADLICQNIKKKQMAAVLKAILKGKFGVQETTEVSIQDVLWQTTQCYRVKIELFLFEEEASIKDILEFLKEMASLNRVFVPAEVEVVTHEDFKFVKGPTEC